MLKEVFEKKQKRTPERGREKGEGGEGEREEREEKILREKEREIKRIFSCRNYDVEREKEFDVFVLN